MEESNREGKSDVDPHPDRLFIIAFLTIEISIGVDKGEISSNEQDNI